jgi:hypothetical protein
MACRPTPDSGIPLGNSNVLCDPLLFVMNPFGKLVYSRPLWPLIGLALLLPGLASCAPRITQTSTLEGPPGTIISLSMEYLVGWPRVEIGTVMMDWPELKLLSADPARQDIRGEELVWIEDKILQFKIPDLAPGEYRVVIHDDKGPPGDPVYSFLETTAYLVFPPVWPFVLRSNQTELKLRVLPALSAGQR